MKRIYNNDKQLINTVKKYEKTSMKQKQIHDQKYVFEIYINNRPKIIIIYKNEDIHNKINELCNKYNFRL